MPEITATTRIAALIGWPASYSLSPALHNAAYEAMGFDAAYVVLPVKVDALPDAITGLTALNVMGASVTVPHKEAVIPFLYRLDETASRLGAVNTVVNRDGKLMGANTDGAGFIASLTDEGVNLEGKVCAVLGAGGAARAITVALADAGAEVLIVNRSHDKAESVAALATRATVGSMEDVKSVEIVVNATPVGMKSHPGIPIDVSLLNDTQVVVDLIYAPAETELLLAAKGVGCRTINGSGMLVHQAAAQVELWTGKPAPIDVMAAALTEALRKSAPQSS